MGYYQVRVRVRVNTPPQKDLTFLSGYVVMVSNNTSIPYFFDVFRETQEEVD